MSKIQHTTKLGKIIKTYRVEHDMTQKEFAETSGLSIVTISLMEQGKLIPSLRLIGKLSTTTGLSFDYLVGSLN